MKLRHSKGLGPYTWDDVETFDDVVIEEEQRIISDLEVGIDKEKVCPFLAKEGNFFYYCKTQVHGFENEKKPYPGHPIYMAHIGTSSLQLFCIQDHEKCINYKKQDKQEKPIGISLVRIPPKEE